MAVEEIIQSLTMSVVIDPRFPRIIAYHLDKDKILGQIQAVNQVKVNGCYFVPEVVFTKLNESTAEYQLNLKLDNSAIGIKIRLQVEENQLWFDVTELNYDDELSIETLDFPSLSFISVNSATPGAQFSGARMSTNTHISGDQHFKVTPELNDFEEGYMYAFLSTNCLAATVWSNSQYSMGKSSYKESTNDHLRLRVTAFESESVKVLSIGSSAWYYQRNHKGIAYPIDTLELPSAKVIITRDLNNDQKIDWQDGAIAYRKIMNHPFGHNRIPDLVAQRIVMNFGSQAQNPFLSTLDRIKKVYLHTDGLGQSLLLKGYGSEGHDSGHLNYKDVGEKIGGIQDFKTLLKEAKKYNASLGVHINVTETYPESPYFEENILKKHEDGSFSYGWNWLDQAINIDSSYDLAHGRAKRFKDLKTIVEDELEFVYVDVWGNGQSGDESAWPSHQLAKQLNNHGWRFAVEWSHSGEYDGTWHHWAVDLPYGGYQLKGINSAITRFIRNHQKDVWVGDIESYGGAANFPLLGGYSLLSFEGWQGHNNYDEYIDNLFQVNLPSKYLQHFQVVAWQSGQAVSMTDNDETYQWTPEMKIRLENQNGVQVIVERESNSLETEGFRRRLIFENNRLILTNDAYLLPWRWDETGMELATTEQKFYYYSQKDLATTWTLPVEWANQTVNIYKLNEFGRELQGTSEVKDGQITLRLEAKSPYVLTRHTNDSAAITWSEGTHLIDRGFNSGTLKHWEIYGDSDAVNLSRSARGNTRLTIEKNKVRTTISQTLTDLKANTQYAAYVGVENVTNTPASLSITGAVNDVMNQTKQSIALNYVKAHPHSTDSKESPSNYQSYFQNLFVFFTTDSQPEKIKLTLAREVGAGQANFDEIRIVENHSKMFDMQHDSIQPTIFSQDFENLAQGIYPFVVAGSEDVEDNRIHLSEFRAPYTQRGWNDKKISDVISGKWSLKINGLTGKEALVIQTIPQNFTFEANTHYRVSFSYEAGWDESYSFVIGEGQYDKQKMLEEFKLLNTWKDSDKAKRVSFEVVGAPTGQTWVGIYSTKVTATVGDKLTKGEINFRSYNDFILDDLVIEKL